MVAKILVYGDVGWSVGNVHKNISIFLKNDFEFDFFEWRHFTVEYVISIMNNYDIIFANYVSLKNFLNFKSTSNLNLKKFIFIFHGYPDLIGYECNNPVLIENFPSDPIYAITSRSISSLFPKDVKLSLTSNGVNLNDFEYKVKDNNTLIKMGWCGEPSVVSKRSDMAIQIAVKSDMLVSFAVKLSIEDLKTWYHNIDLLVITSGPNEWNETGPLPAFEAIVSGTLVIGTRVGNFNNIPGPKFDTVDEAAIIIKDLKINPELQQQIRKEQYDYVKTNYSYDILKLQWKQVFLESLKNSNNNNIINI
jgi:hypothetical protein